MNAELKAAQQKIISYAWVSAVTQEPNENPIAFLERLKEALQKFTNLDRSEEHTSELQSRHNLLRDPQVQGSQEVDMP